MSTYSRKVIGKIDFENGHKIIITLVDNPKFPQKQIDIRHHIKVPQGGYEGLTKKGVRIPGEHLPYLAKLLNDSLKEVVRDG